MSGRSLPREPLTPGVEEAAMRDYLAPVPDVDTASRGLLEYSAPHPSWQPG